LELVRQEGLLSRSLRASSGLQPTWSNEPARFAMKFAGEQPSPRPAVRDGMKQELYESRCSHRGSKSKGVGRVFSAAARDDVRILPQAPALLHRTMMSFLIACDPSFAPQFLFAEFFVWKKMRG
jgi:hypothetical protein